jgi:hypothetical protein
VCTYSSDNKEKESEEEEEEEEEELPASKKEKDKVQHCSVINSWRGREQSALARHGASSPSRINPPSKKALPLAKKRNRRKKKKEKKTATEEKDERLPLLCFLALALAFFDFSMGEICYVPK